jgi:hypothetical protein
MNSGQLKTLPEVRSFLLAGNATLTIVGKSSRYTYNVKKAEDREERDPRRPEGVYFVSLLSGADNNNDYRYLGIIEVDARAFSPYTFRRTAKSKIAANAPSHVAFAWLFHKLFEKNYLPDTVEVWHEGRCGRCNRKLTVPESIEAGIGPECASRMEGAA